MMTRTKDYIIDNLVENMTTDFGAGLIFGGANEIVGLIATFAFKLIGFNAKAIRVSQGYILLVSLGLFLIIFGGTALHDFRKAQRQITAIENNKEVGDTNGNSNHG